jgi:hypothetical protein
MLILDNLPVANYATFGSYKFKIYIILTLFLITRQLCVYLFNVERVIAMLFAFKRNSVHAVSMLS